MIGGKVIEITDRRIWCVGIGSDDGDECAVFYENDHKARLPALGEEIWWQAGRIYYGPRDEISLRKVANSHDPRNTHE
mgnify:CR=1 FL=1